MSQTPEVTEVAPATEKTLLVNPKVAKVALLAGAMLLVVTLVVIKKNINEAEELADLSA